MSDIFTVCLTGGPCAGKSTIIEKFSLLKEIHNYKILTVPEAATLLKINGINHEESEYLYQQSIFEYQIFLENLFKRYAESIGKDTIIIHDRGIHDALAYIEEDLFDDFCKQYNFKNIFNNYDCTIHLVSVAYDKPKLYNLENKARRENLNQAIEKELKTKELSIKCENNFIVDNSCGNINDKFFKVLNIIEDQIILRNQLT